MFRYIISEAANAIALGRFTTGNTVTITVYKKSDGSVQTLASDVCTEIGTTGYFKWPWANLDTAPTVFTEYFWEMDNGASAQRRAEVIFGGYPDTLVTAAVGATGASAQTIVIEDQSSNPIPTVGVNVYDATNTTLITSGTTNPSGVVIFNLNDATYILRMVKSQVTFNATETLVVAGDGSQTFNGVTSTIAAPVLPNVCRVYDYARNQSGGAPLQGIDATAQITGIPLATTAGFHTGQKVDDSYTTSTGLFYWDLPYGAIVAVKVKELEINKTITVPSAATALLSDIPVN